MESHLAARFMSGQVCALWGLRNKGEYAMSRVSQCCRSRETYQCLRCRNKVGLGVRSTQQVDSPSCGWRSHHMRPSDDPGIINKPSSRYYTYLLCVLVRQAGGGRCGHPRVGHHPALQPSPPRGARPTSPPVPTLLASIRLCSLPAARERPPGVQFGYDDTACRCGLLGRISLGCRGRRGLGTQGFPPACLPWFLGEGDPDLFF
jgi:hypothetical protein